MRNKIFKTAGSLSLLLFLLLAFQVNGQLVVDSDVTAEQMVANILGPGVTATNIELNCDDIGSGAFTNGGSTNIGIDDGVILTSGDINDAPGPNDDGGTSFSSSAVGDADLDDLIAPFSTEDACVLEFDFIATGNEITVQYVFASEEYNEYVCSQFNDVFAFFVSGNNPTGGVYLNENVALVPGDAEAVAINNVNNGSAGANGSEENCGSLDNTAFFIDNSALDPTSTIGYDGFTVSLFATVNIIPGETYHFKFAIADASDSQFDSGVFLKAESFSIFTCDAGTLSIEGSAEICTDDDVEDIVEVFTTSILPDDTYVYLLTNAVGEILALQSSNSINVEAYPNGTYFIYGVSYDGGSPFGLEVGGNVGNISNPDGCMEISDPLTIVLTDCATVGCTDQSACNYNPNATVDDGSCFFCDDQDPCTIDDCNPATGGCIFTPVDCDDGNPCTLDECDPSSSTGCLNTPFGNPINDNSDGALSNTADRIWGVPGWDTFDVSCATLSAPTCDGSVPLADSWYSFVAQAENQGILVRANPADPNAGTADMAVEIFDDTFTPLIGLSGGTCAVSRSCFNNVGAGEIERCVPGGLTIGDTYYYRTYDASGGDITTVDTKVKTYASHPIVVGCVPGDEMGFANTWTIESRNALYNIPPVPVFNVRMVIKDLSGTVVSMTPNQDASIPLGLMFSLEDFIPSPGPGDYTVHAQHDVKMHANGCVSAYWSQTGPGCDLSIEPPPSIEIPVAHIGPNSNWNFTAYPNPNEGDQVYISMNKLLDENQKIIVEVFDMFGKKVHDEQFANSGNEMNRIITFDQNLSAGIYLISISVNGTIETKKLKIE